MTIRSWQDTIELPTYPLGPDDPNPPFQRQGSSWAIYPYPMRDDLLEGRATPQAYTALHLENEYLHCIVLPELGGHLYSLYDKVCQREVFYRNRVVKYGLVSVRGAWISGGIEFNFPMGHTYTTVDPVSWQIGDGEDTAWLAVGNICRLSRMEWWVRLSLAAGARRLHEQVWLRNRMPYKQRYWFWNNSAVPAAPDLHLVYPARKARVGGRVVDYPLANGRDISWYPAHDHADDIFTLGVKEDFFGCHYDQADFGMVNVSSHHDVRGRKYFTWGTADDGMIWVDLLTDSDGQYIEIQSGRFETQSIWEFLQPYETVSWEEFWMPEHGLGGWVWANDMAVLNFAIRDRHLELGVLPVANLKNALLSLEANGDVVWQQTITAGPKRPYRTEIAMPRGCTEATPFVLTLHDPDDEYGGEIIRYEHPPRHTRQPRVAETGEDREAPPKPEDLCTAEELCVRANDAWKRLETGTARRLFEKALTLDTGFCSALVGLGLLDFLVGLYAKACERLTAAVARDPDRVEAWYYLGLARYRAGDLDAAVDALIAADRLDSAGPARELLRDIDELTAAGDDEIELDHEALPALIQDRDFGLDAITPDDTVQPEPSLEAFRHWARGDVQNWLEMAFTCAPAEASRLLELARRKCPAADAYPLVHYCLAHWYRHLGRLKEALEADRRAMACAPHFCFPSRLEELAILEVTVERLPRDWKARLYLGNLYAALGRGPEALTQWREAVKINDSCAVLHRNLGFGALQWEHDPVQAAQHYRRAMERNPDDYRYYLEIARLYSRHPEAARLAAGKREAQTQAQLDLLMRAPPVCREKWQVAARVAELLLALQRYDEALDVLRRHRFFPWEGARQMRDVYASCLVAKGEAAAAAGDRTAALAAFEAAMEYPRNLGVGKVARPQDARLTWLAATAAKAAGDLARHQQYLNLAADEPHAGPCEADAWKLLALRALGRADQALALERSLRDWASGLLDDPERAELGRTTLDRIGP